MVKEIYKSQVYYVKNKTLHEKQKRSLVRCSNGNVADSIVLKMNNH